MGYFTSNTFKGTWFECVTQAPVQDTVTDGISGDGLLDTWRAQVLVWGRRVAWARYTAWARYAAWSCTDRHIEARRPYLAQYISVKLGSLPPVTSVHGADKSLAMHAGRRW